MFIMCMIMIFNISMQWLLPVAVPEPVIWEDSSYRPANP